MQNLSLVSSEEPTYQSFNPERVREANVVSLKGSCYFAFGYRGKEWMFASRLAPQLLRRTSGDVSVQIVNRDGKLGDFGSLFVDLQYDRLIPRDFRFHFAQCLEKPAALVAGHFSVGERLLLVVHNGFYERAREARSRGEQGIFHVCPADLKRQPGARPLYCH